MAKKGPDTGPVADPDNEGGAWQVAAERLKELNAVVRHDVFNQLTILIGFLQFSEDLVDDPDIKEFIQKEITAGSNIQKLMELTREYQDMVLQPPCWLSVSDMAQEACQALMPGEAPIDDASPDVEVFASPLIARVLLTVAENVLKYSKAPPCISFSSTENDDGSLGLIIENESGGVPEAERAMLFERSHGQDGGYGLWLARELLSLTGITINETGDEERVRFEMTVPADCWRPA